MKNNKIPEILMTVQFQNEIQLRKGNYNAGQKQ